MDTPGYIVLSRLAAAMRATDVLAHNLANADTPGFRAERSVFGAVLARQKDISPLPGGQQLAYTQDRATWRETEAGPLQNTGNPLDLALAGNGFFAVQTARGERYTRAGRFMLSANGTLLDHEGNQLLNTNSQPIRLTPADTDIRVTGDGTISSQNGPLGKLRIVDFADYQGMRAEGSRLFASTGNPTPVQQSGVVQGMIEGSNVQPVAETVRMTEALRKFQLVAQFADKEGQRLGDAVSRILAVRN